VEVLGFLSAFYSAVSDSSGFYLPSLNSIVRKFSSSYLRFVSRPVFSRSFSSLGPKFFSGPSGGYYYIPVSRAGRVIRSSRVGVVSGSLAASASSLLPARPTIAIA